MSATHYMHSPDGEAFCGRVPKCGSTRTTQYALVTCRWCLRALGLMTVISKAKPKGEPK